MSDLAPPSNPYDSLPVTPRTRSAAEDAFLNNSLTQTASAGQAPVADSPQKNSSITGRPPFPTRSSNNYAEATTTAPLTTTTSEPPTIAPRPKAIKMPTSPSDDDLAAQNAAAEKAWLNEQAAAKRTSVDMRSDNMAAMIAAEKNKSDDAPKRLGQHGRQQSWSAQDMKRQMQEPLMKGGGQGVSHGYSGS